MKTTKSLFLLLAFGTVACERNLSKKDAQHATKETSQGINEKTIPYETLENKKGLGGKVILDLLVSETATKQEVMSLAEHLHRKYLGKYQWITIYDSRETHRRNLDESLSDEELYRHLLVQLDAVGDVGIHWVAKGRNH